LKNAQKDVCIANLKQMDAAILGWSIETKKSSTDIVSFTDLNFLQYLKGTILPVCPAGGIYTAGKTVVDAPICSLSRSQGHSLGPNDRAALYLKQDKPSR
jgi:hypothetical protein